MNCRERDAMPGCLCHSPCNEPRKADSNSDCSRHSMECSRWMDRRRIFWPFRACVLKSVRDARAKHFRDLWWCYECFRCCCCCCVPIHCSWSRGRGVFEASVVAHRNDFRYLLVEVHDVCVFAQMAHELCVGEGGWGEARSWRKGGRKVELAKIGNLSHTSSFPNLIYHSCGCVLHHISHCHSEIVLYTFKQYVRCSFSYHDIWIFRTIISHMIQIFATMCCDSSYA